MADRTVHDFIAGEKPTAALLDEIPKGWQGSNQLTSNVGSITASEVTLTGLTTTVIALASRKLRVDVYLQIQSSVANDVARIRIKQDGTVVAIGHLCIPVTGGVELSCHVLAVENPSAGARTYTVTVERLTGSGTLQVTAGSTNPSRILISDIGPAT